MSTPRKSTKTVGRPERSLAWPVGKFTINDLVELQKLEPDESRRLKRIGIQYRIKQAVEKGEIKEVGKNRVLNLGRPSVLYECIVKEEVCDEDPFAPENEVDYYI